MRYLLICLLLLCNVAAFAQIELKSKVMDDTGTPVPFATISEVGTKSAVTCDANGSFLIRVKKLPVKLMASAVGFVSQTRQVTTAGSLPFFFLTRSENTMNEVVVTALGVRRKAESIGYSTALEGRVSGIKITRSGDPKRREDKAGGSALTAGELNDFKKWQLWSDYTPEEFQTTSSRWGMTLKRRYCVQLLNDASRPVVGEAVYLVSLAGDTVWSAVSDNTGKAELWADAARDTTAAMFLHSAGQRVEAKAWSVINRLQLHRQCNTRSAVDIAFVVDATGSMGDEIRYLQTELNGVITGIRKEHGNLDLRLASVFYRDETDSYLTKHSAFTSKTSELLNFIREQSAGGGGDFPEAVDAALGVALDSLQWSGDARARILFLMLDAPPHDAARERMQGLVRRAAARGIRIVPVVCSGIDKPTEYLMRCLALATNGSYVFLTDDSGIGDTHLKPTTDKYTVELLGDVLQRLVREMVFVPECDVETDAPVKEQATDLRVHVYPNPTTDFVTLQSRGEITEVLLTDFAGKVLQKPAPGRRNRWRVELGAYPSGTYLLRYQVAGKVWGTAKVVLAR